MEVGQVRFVELLHLHLGRQRVNGPDPASDLRPLRHRAAFSVELVVFTHANNDAPRHRVELRGDHHVGGDLARRVTERHDVSEFADTVGVHDARPVDQRHHRHHAQVVHVAAQFLPAARQCGLGLVEHGLIGQIQRQVLLGLVVLGPAFDRRSDLAGARVTLGVHLLRRLHRDHRNIGVRGGADDDIRAALRQRVHVRLLRRLVQPVGLPELPQPVLDLLVDAESLHIQALLQGVDHQPRPVHDHRPDAAFHLPDQLRGHVLQMLAAFVVPRPHRQVRLGAQQPLPQLAGQVKFSHARSLLS